MNHTVAQVFEELGVAYYLCGSMASSYHDLYRATADADFVADLKLEHVNPFAQSLQADFT